MTIRKSLEAALNGEQVKNPVYMVYDWFVDNCRIDWQSLFDQGLGRINHATIAEYERPNVQIVETERVQDCRVRKDITWVTKKGELHEWFVDGWRQEYLIKKPEDYEILACAFEGSKFIAKDEQFIESEKQLGDNGITIGQIGPVGRGRTPFQAIQIDFAGLERFSIDIALEETKLINLIELMNNQMIDAIKCILPSKATHIKLWENLSIETMGPNLFRKYLVPLYKRIFEVLDGSGKKLQVHYDGKLNAIKDDIAEIPFDGIDSLTPEPEGDMEIKEARRIWPDKFFWMNPSLSWFQKSDEELLNNIKKIAEEAGGYRFCLMISEDVPLDWQIKVPLILNRFRKN